MRSAEFITLMAMLMAMNSLAIDIMLPSLPEIAKTLHVVSENDRQHVISFYLIGFGIAQLFYGPFSDRFGRKVVILTGLYIYMLSSITVLAVDSFTELLILRFIQGIGAAATRVITVSIIRDLYHGKEMAKIMSITIMLFMAMPILAPVIGQSIILITNSWYWIFISMAIIISILILWCSLRLPETLDPKDRRPLNFISVAEGLVSIFKNRLAIFYTLANSLILGSLLGFVSTSQQIYTEVYDLGVLFPLAFAIGGVSISIASLINSRLVEHLGARLVSHLAMISFVGITSLWFLIQISEPTPMNIVIFISFFFLATFNFALMNSNFTSICMEPFPNLAGMAASIFGFINTIASTIISVIIGQFYNKTTLPIVTSYFIISIITLFLVLFAEKGKLFKHSR
ncbi:major facilitator transporter [Liberibacter crescens]|nr:major facilitator transporter [Liberibacter crescens]